MKSMDEYASALLSSANAEKLKSAVSSEEGRRLAAGLDAEEVERAARAGDAAALKDILARVLSTPDGRALAQKVHDAMKKD